MSGEKITQSTNQIPVSEKPSEGKVKIESIIDEVKIAIITALPEEYAAMQQLIENSDEQWLPAENNKRSRQYCFGDIPSIKTGGGNHKVVLTQSGQGTNKASVRATNVLSDFPNTKHIIMTGIAAGVPAPKDPEKDVRLGDIVVSNEKGVIQYDFGKETLPFLGKYLGFLIREIFEYRSSSHRPSAELLEGIRFLKARIFKGERPWDNHTQTVINELSKIDTFWQRPPIDSDPHKDHKSLPLRKERNPMVFHGPIAGANKVLKNARSRDKLRERYGVRAIEMETPGIVDATWDHEVGYLAVRGASDYGDSTKNDEWRYYAAATAAAYTRSLIESLVGDKKKLKNQEECNPEITQDILRQKYTQKNHIESIDKPLPIESCYTRLAIVKDIEQERKEQALRSQKNNSNDIEEFCSLNTADKWDHYVKKKKREESPLSPWENIYQTQEDIDLENIFDRGKHLVILGRAGIGKSTLCQYIAYQWSQRELWTEQFSHVFWIPLREINERNFPQFKEPEDGYSLVDVVNTLLFKRKPKLSNSQLEDLLNTGKVLFLLDGYDEAPRCGLDEKTGYLESVIDEVIQQAKQGNYILTSRPDQIKGIPRDEILEVLGFGDDEIEDNIKKLLPEEKQASFLKFLDNNPQAKSQCHIPLHLHLFCSIWDKDKDKENDDDMSDISMTELYERIVRHLMNRHVRKKERNPAKLSPEKKKFSSNSLKILGHVAYTAMQQGQLLITADAIDKSIENIDKSITLQDIHDIGIIKAIGSSGELNTRDSYFLHLTLQEYFVARYISEQLSPDKQFQFIRKNRYDPRYEETLCFLSGIQSEDNGKSCDFFNALLADYDKDSMLTHDIAMLFKCMYACGRNADQHKEVMKETLKLIMEELDIIMKQNIRIRIDQKKAIHEILRILELDTTL